MLFANTACKRSNLFELLEITPHFPRTVQELFSPIQFRAPRISHHHSRIIWLCIHATFRAPTFLPSHSITFHCAQSTGWLFLQSRHFVFPWDAILTEILKVSTCAPSFSGNTPCSNFTLKAPDVWSFRRRGGQRFRLPKHPERPNLRIQEHRERPADQVRNSTLRPSQAGQSLARASRQRTLRTSQTGGQLDLQIDVLNCHAYQNNTWWM